MLGVVQRSGGGGGGASGAGGPEVEQDWQLMTEQVLQLGLQSGVESRSGSDLVLRLRLGLGLRLGPR